jgi:hypothetical protein
MKWVRIAAASTLGFTLAVASAAPASAAKPDKEQKEQRKEVREARKELREALKDGGAGSPAAHDARKKLEESREKLKESRAERRKAKLAELKAKYGDIVDKPAVRAELRLHAMRMARLHRLERIATAEGKDDAAKRVQALVTKENARHAKRMDELKAHAGEDTK